MARILIVEDEPDIVLSLEEDLRRQGHDTVVAADGATACDWAASRAGISILLDVMLPKLDGFDVCSELRKAGVATPIIMLTARTQEAEKELGLDSGADDYVTKPFSLRELRARIRAQLRRATRDEPARLPVRRLRSGLRLAPSCGAAGRPVEITPQELRLLGVFLDNRGRVLSRDQLIAGAWGHGMAITDRAVDTHVFNLRKKIEPQPSSPTFLVSVRGLGYRFESQS